MTDDGPAIEDYLLEDRTFPPPEEFKEQSLAAGTFLAIVTATIVFMFRS